MKENLNDLRTFIAVAQTGSFTKAGAQMGVSASALSHAIRALENRLHIRLFHRTTRSISLTEAGRQLYTDLVPLFEAIDAGLNNLGNFRNTLRGNLRINGNQHAFRYVLWKKLQSFIRRHPEISLELACEPRMVDIVAERFDAGIRLGGYIAQDMVAVRISPPLTMRIIASPAYLSAHGTPQTPADLSAHECHSSRQPTTGAVWTWDLRHPQSGKTLQFHPQARLLANGSSELLKQIALADLGLVCVFDDIVSGELASGALVSVLDDWAISYDGYYLYYPNHHISSPVLNALVAALRE